MTIYSSGRRDKLTADPYPYRIEVRAELLDPAERDDYIANREEERISSPEWVTFWDAEFERCVLDPRPEYDRPLSNPSNPILAGFRQDYRAQPGDEARTVGDYLFDLDETNIRNYATPAQIDHAHKVLTRLANLTKEQNA